MKIKDLLYFIYYRFYRFVKIINAPDPYLSTTAFFFLMFVLLIGRIIILLYPDFGLIFVKNKLLINKIVYYIIGIVILFILSIFFEKKVKKINIEEKFENVNVKTKRIADILIILYFIVISLSFIL